MTDNPKTPMERAEEIATNIIVEIDNNLCKGEINRLKVLVPQITQAIAEAEARGYANGVKDSLEIDRINGQSAE